MNYEEMVYELYAGCYNALHATRGTWWIVYPVTPLGWKDEYIFLSSPKETKEEAWKDAWNRIEGQYPEKHLPPHIKRGDVYITPKEYIKHELGIK